MTLSRKTRIIFASVCAGLVAVALIIGVSVRNTNKSNGGAQSTATVQENTSTGTSGQTTVVADQGAPTEGLLAITSMPVTESTVSPTGSPTIEQSIYCADQTLRCGTSTCCSSLYQSCDAGACVACNHKTGFCGVERKCCKDSERCVITEPISNGRQRMLRANEDNRGRALWSGSCVPEDPITCSGAPIGVYQQCGGLDYFGSTCCDIGLECQARDPWWSGCFQTALAIAPLYLNFPLVTSGCITPVLPHQQCGGADFHGSTCCLSGYTCTYVNYWWSGCETGVTSSPTSAPTALELALVPVPIYQPIPIAACAHNRYPNINTYPELVKCFCDTAGGLYKMLSDGACVHDPFPSCLHNQNPIYFHCICDTTGGIFNLDEFGNCVLTITPNCTHKQDPIGDVCICDVDGGHYKYSAGWCVEDPLPLCKHNDYPEYDYCTCADAGFEMYYQMCLQVPRPPCEIESIIDDNLHCACGAPNLQQINNRCYPAAVQLRSCGHNEAEISDQCTCGGGVSHFVAQICEGGPPVCVLINLPACQDGHYMDCEHCACDVSAGFVVVSRGSMYGYDSCKKLQ